MTTNEINEDYIISNNFVFELLIIKTNSQIAMGSRPLFEIKESEVN